MFNYVPPSLSSNITDNIQFSKKILQHILLSTLVIDGIEETMHNMIYTFFGTIFFVPQKLMRLLMSDLSTKFGLLGKEEGHSDQLFSGVRHLF